MPKSTSVNFTAGRVHTFNCPAGKMQAFLWDSAIKGWCARLGLKGNYGSHTLRKTWGYHQRVTFGTDIGVIMQAFGHSRPNVTMRYIGIQQTEVENAYLNSL